MKKFFILVCTLFCTVILFAQTNEEKLVRAAYEGQFEVVVNLLSDPFINVNERYHGDTALVNASSQGHLNIVKELLKNPAINVDKTGNLEVTPLIAASIGGYTDIVKELLKHSVNINKTDITGYTALMWAAKKGYFDVAVELLHQHNIMITTTFSPIFDNALLLAYNNHHRDIVLEILNLKPQLQSVFDEGFEKFGYNQKDSNGKTLLMLAARDGDIEIVRSLLNLNIQQSRKHKLFYGEVIDVNLTDNDRNSALMLAAKCGHLEVVEKLLTQKGIRLDYTDIFGRNAYQLAATQEIKDAIAKRQNMLKKTSEALEKQILEGLERFQLDK